ncbi:MAG: PAS domain S-box protein, partial [Gammaproteobacteria bacterium]|nr:PAS domain S-box protein [Gammaproteobacteria bacterium]
MGNHNIHILLVEDDPDQIQLIRAVFDLQTEQIDLTVATHLADARARLGQFKPDLVIIDLLLPDGNGLELLPKAKQKPHYPFVILTAHGNEHMAVEALKRGALDYLVKDERTFKDLPHVVRRTLREWDHIIERKHAEKALEKANQALEKRVKVRTAELLEINLRLQRQITKRKQAERSIKRHFCMEGIVTTIATRFINLPRQEIDGAIQQALEVIGQFTGVDRSYLLLLSEEGNALSNTHEWCAEGIPAQIQDLQDMPAKSFEWALNPLRRGEVLHIPSVGEMPSAAASFQKVLQQGGIYSILNVPLLWARELRGVIGFDTVNESKKWKEQDLTLLQTVATIFSNALQRQQTEKRLRQSEARLAEAQHIAHLGSWELNLTNDKLTWSEEVFRILEVDNTQFDPSYKSFLEHVHPDDRAWVHKAYRDSIKDKIPYDTVHRLRLKNGSIKYVHERCETFYDGDGKPLRSVGTVQDITDRRQDQEQLRLAASVFESTMEGVTITDANTHIIAVNRAFTEITGYTEEEVLGKNPRVLKSDRHDSAFYQGMWKSILQTGRWRGEIWERSKTGEVYPAWLTINAVRSSDKLLTHYVATFSDISALKHSQAKLNHLAHHDALTDLPNRLLLGARLEHCIERARRDRDQVAILFLDLDDFKQINDSLGHPMGDKVLKQVAARLFSRVREDDTVA